MLCQYFFVICVYIFIDLLFYAWYSIFREKKKEGDEVEQGERVREIRKSLGLSLEKFGEKLGVGKMAISNIENGNRNLTERMAKSICREYNVSYDYLTSGEGEMFSDLPDTVLDELCMQYDLDAYDKKLLEIYLELPKSARDAIKEIIKKKFGPEE